MSQNPDRSDPLNIAGSLIADKYRIDHAVGEGGFSVVYRAEHVIWKQPVALKCFTLLAGAPTEQREQLLQAFIQEGKLMTELSSRSAAIVQARDIGTFNAPDGQWLPYMVLEWLDGRPLDQVLFDETSDGAPPRDLRATIALLESAAIALDLVHSRSIAHRDIKPANLFVVGQPRDASTFVKVLDFGIAKVMADHAAAATALAHTGKDITAFTPSYGAPEQFSRTHGATGPWTDVFAMALIMIEVMLGGAPALQGDDYLQLAVASRDPSRRPTPRTLGLAVSDEVEAVFAKALAVAPADRFPTMGRFWSALHRAVFPEDPAWALATGGSSLAPPSGAPSPRASAPRLPSSPRISLQAQTAPTMAAPSTAPGPLPTPTSQPVSVAGSSTAGGAASDAAPRSKGPLLLGGVALALAAGGAITWNLLRGTLPAGEASRSAPVATASATAATPTASAATAAAALSERPTECPAGMVLVPGGKFFMGSDEPEFKLWQPAHKVTIDTFCIDVHEVTAGDYMACSDKGECKRPPAAPDFPNTDGSPAAAHQKTLTVLAEQCTFGKPELAKHPINCLPWSLANAYCQVHGKRLPTEAEWEYAARGSDGRKFPWGDKPGDQTFMNACGTECTAWEKAHGLKPSERMYEADDGFAGTAPVGSFPNGRTRFGADDVVGNVWEWTADWFETYKDEEQVNPKGAPAGDRKAIRGGAYNGGFALWLNPAFRYHQLATASAPGIGFRCAARL
ncbi:SUMF1/EgtB/PvdO family nonheme iron enzyme [Sorangium atrum]|uniref:SUMF1/EgtB/PvdO family nonheme iron enzyme n=1 Tax=Sorangium atrum TaxID=2995308 RepID=A0ABT5BXC1_9BACT|nr:SUMF1/EgtB/PvdO family nonheme iron enzyme [Sorangium aterium]MDC0678235.1 SUMF1/EgtB/PvdO family nonheme iron enzyme [Sorangium aterium]